jgi:cation diffusion facilitator family transporter
MQAQAADDWVHHHAFDHGNPAAERGTRAVMLITAAMMVVEILAGWLFNSMALLADGWHMSSHAVAIGLSALAYAAARRYAQDQRFVFGTWKIEILAGFASAMFLLMVAALMVFGSCERLLAPQEIHFDQAIVVAVIGLLVNVLCAVILAGAHSHPHGHAHGHDEYDHVHHHDLNLKSAYIHVAADAATSVLAVSALVGGKYFAWNWLDPVMGLVGAALVGAWAWGLIRDTGRILLDYEADQPMHQEIAACVEANPQWQGTRVTDLHVWRVGKGRYACILCLLTDERRLLPGTVKNALSHLEQLVHITIEVNERPRASSEEGQS